MTRNLGGPPYHGVPRQLEAARTLPRKSEHPWKAFLAASATKGCGFEPRRMHLSRLK